MLKQHPQIHIVTLSLISLTVLRVHWQMLLFFEKLQHISAEKEFIEKTAE
jgi:hypothetical protein